MLCRRQPGAVMREESEALITVLLLEPEESTQSGNVPICSAVEAAARFQPPGGNRLAKKDCRLAAMRTVTRPGFCSVVVWTV